MPNRLPIAARTTHFINVDLDIVSERDLTPLVEALSPQMHVLFNGRARGKFRATLEVGGAAALASSPIARSPDKLVRRMTKLVAALPRARRADWNRATERRFDLGFESVLVRPPPLELNASTIRAVADVGGSIVVTVYPNDERTVGPA